MPDTAIAYTYLAEANTDPDGAARSYLPGVPLRDLTADEVAAMPAHIQAAIATSPIYAATDAAPPLPADEEAP